MRFTDERQVTDKSVTDCYHVTTDPLSDPLLAFNTIEANSGLTTPRLAWLIDLRKEDLVARPF
jgi:hypothetical protein